MVNRTLKSKFIVITLAQEDINETRKFIKNTLEISELGEIDASRLLMNCAKESKHLKGFKNERELSKHEIFKVFPKKP